MRDCKGQAVTTSAGIATVLCEHWQQTFNYKDTDRNLRDKWLDKMRDTCKVGKEQVRPTKADVETAISEATASAPGPDGVPTLAWAQNVDASAFVL